MPDGFEDAFEVVFLGGALDEHVEGGVGGGPLARPFLRLLRTETDELLVQVDLVLRGVEQELQDALGTLGNDGFIRVGLAENLPFAVEHVEYLRGSFSEPRAPRVLVKRTSAPRTLTTP